MLTNGKIKCPESKCVISNLNQSLWIVSCKDKLYFLARMEAGHMVVGRSDSVRTGSTHWKKKLCFGHLLCRKCPPECIHSWNAALSWFVFISVCKNHWGRNRHVKSTHSCLGATCCAKQYRNIALFTFYNYRVHQLQFTSKKFYWQVEYPF